MSVNEIELSVRLNCLNNANYNCWRTGNQSEPEMLKYRNFGKKNHLMKSSKTGAIRFAGNEIRKPFA